MRTRTSKHRYTFSILITFSLSCIELKVNFASFDNTSLSSFVIIKKNLSSSELRLSKCLLLFANDLYKAFLSHEYSGHLITKWNSFSILSLHMKHFLSFRSIFGLKCLPYSINRSWFDTLKRVKAILCFLFFTFVRYFSR